MKLYVTDFENQQAWLISNPSRAFLLKHDNGALVSIGLTVPNDVKPETVRRWVAKGFAAPVDYDESNHSGCQSSCVRRGAEICRW